MSAIDLSRIHKDEEECSDWADTALFGNGGEVFSPSLPEEPNATENLLGSTEIAANGFANLSFRGLCRREIVLGLGGSLGLHASVLILALLLSFSLRSWSVSGPQYLTVSLIGTSGLGAGTAGGRGGAASKSADSASQPAGSVSSAKGSEHMPLTAAAPPKSGSVVPKEHKETEKSPNKNPKPVLHQVTELPKPLPPAPPQTARRKTAKKDLRAHPSRTRRSHRKAAKRVASAKLSEVSRSSSQLSSRKAGPRHDSGSAHGEGSGATLDQGAGSGRGPGGGGSPGRRGAGTGTFGLNQVDTPPSVTRRVIPEYPRAARSKEITGRVVVKFLVRTDGSVGKASVVKASPPGIFEQSALQAIRKWKFKPGRYRGDAVATWVILPIRFRLAR